MGAWDLQMLQIMAIVAWFVLVIGYDLYQLHTLQLPYSLIFWMTTVLLKIRPFELFVTLYRMMENSL